MATRAPDGANKVFWTGHSHNKDPLDNTHPKSQIESEQSISLNCIGRKNSQNISDLKKCILMKGFLAKPSFTKDQ